VLQTPEVLASIVTCEVLEPRGAKVAEEYVVQGLGVGQEID
jgi:hypothetical protein